MIECFLTKEQFILIPTTEKNQFNMESDDVMWAVSFTTLIFSLHLVNNLTVKSLKAKPTGKQTIFDSALIDTFLQLNCMEHLRV